MSNKLLLQDLIDRLSEIGKLKKKDAEEFLRVFFKVIEDSLFKGEVIKIQGLGTFKLLKVNARKSVNVVTGEEFEIGEHYKVSFNPDPTLKELVNKPFSHLEPVDLDQETDKGGTVEQNIPESKRIKDQEENSAEIIVEKTEPDKTDKIEEINIESINKRIIDLYSAGKNSNNIETKPISDSGNSSEKLKKNNHIRSRIIWTVFSLIVISLAIWSFVSNQAATREFKYKMEESEKYELSQKKVFLADNVAHMGEDSLSTTKPDTSVSSNKFPVTMRTKRGCRLTMISLKYYGHKVFWVYIYNANKDIIKNPNIVPIGVRIRIPKPEPSIIDATNPECIAKAKALQTKILSK